MDEIAVAALFEYSPNPTWLADSDGRCLYANRALREISAVSADRFPDLNWLEFVTDASRDRSCTLWQKVLAHHQPFRARLLLKGKDSASSSAMDVVGVRYLVPGGSEVWLFTAEPSGQTTKAPRPDEANLQMTLDALPIQAWYARASGSIVFANTAAAKYLGLPPDHPLRYGGDSKASWDAHLVFLHPEDRAESRTNWTEYIRTGVAREDRFRVLGADGDYRWFLTQAAPIRDSHGRVRYWIGVNIDIDDRKRASDALDIAREQFARATQSALIAEISASLAHKIVQPVAAVVANARAALNWLSSENLNISQANAALQGVVRDGMSIGNVVHEMRQLLDHRRPNPSAVDLNTLVEQMIALQAPDLREKRIAIKCELDPAIPVAFADVAQIQQVLFNLMSDAREATSLSGGSKELTVTTRVLDDTVCLEIQDNCGCIPDLEHMLNAACVDKSRGTVIPLAVSRSIVEAQGGTLGANCMEGGATRVRIALPRFNAP